MTFLGKVAAAGIAAVFVTMSALSFGIDSVSEPAKPMTLSEAQSICGGAAYADPTEEPSGTANLFRCYDGKLVSSR